MEKKKYSTIFMSWQSDEREKRSPDYAAANAGATTEALVHLFERVEAIEKIIEEGKTDELTE